MIVLWDRPGKKHQGTEVRMQAARRHTGIYYFLIGMLIPIILAGIGFILIGIWPFGDGTVLIIDSLHQYLPFYTDFHEKLRSG